MLRQAYIATCLRRKAGRSTHVALIGAVAQPRAPGGRRNPGRQAVEERSLSCGLHRKDSDQDQDTAENGR